ncbi:hypothetical protein PR048_015539 [Dryococelus australis]|uniref:Uncharacterized protein n=1 Tax=Dryococelus australis TaxID=614101 RepID=A0ABQ9HHD1_9NEOP|nr:hypothetical protein PR048_015539 [Dryococelus australis]
MWDTCFVGCSMGTRSNSEGESSGAGCSRMDCSSDEVPPRKVRCTWQIQGKYCQRTEGRDEAQVGDDPPGVHDDWEPELELSSYLQIWQVEQLGRSCIDNLMNRALEDAHGGPHGGEGSVEDTAVLAAIHNHGLQMPRRCQPRLCSACVHPLGPPASQPLEHTTFMDAAVTAAIQRKGLSSLSAADV